MSKIDENIKKLKMWQEELKLVMMIFATISTVALFFSKLFKGQIEPLKVAEISNDARSNIPRIYLTSKSPDYSILIIGILSVLFLTLLIYFLIKVIKKHKKITRD